MSDPTEKKAHDLREAVRRARLDDVERAGIVADLREEEFARLDLLQARLEAIFAQIPAEVDLFDHGIVAGDRPRCYIDVLAFVEMERDRRTYRFEVDTRRGRVVVAISEDVEVIATAVTDYVARRLVERERALSNSRMVFAPADEGPDRQHALPAPAAQLPTEEPAAAAVPPARPARRFDWGDIIFTFLFGGLIGAAIFQAVLWFLASGMPVPAFLERLFGPTSI
ncbi:hypothetical protein ACFQU1_07410 [Chelatococcus sp. GCM10030263]|uniref:hypothetical protein n=1 Tax=Chelatococcus sp. GCM10030263 TaxID=3273387 RepID=UPI0036072638